MIIDFNKISQLDRYKVLSKSIHPRPIAWISTDSIDGINLAPFSYFTPLSSNPPTVIVAIGHKKTNNQPKDTLKNILDNKKCTISIPTIAQIKHLESSATELEYNISETDLYNIKTKKIDKNFPDMIDDSKIAFMCEYMQSIDINSKTTPLVLEIKKVWVSDDIVDDNLDIDILNFARVGKKYYKLEEIL